MSLFFRYRLLFVLVVMAPLSGCLFHSRKVERKMSTAPLKTATQADLINYINEQAKKVQSMQATVDIDASVGGEQKGTVTDYKQIRGYVLARKPLMLRMIGLMPIVRNKAFDMVSNGKNFKVWIPPKNRFVEGRNDYISPNKQPSLENLRPQAIYEAILIPEIDSKNGEIAVMQSDYEQVLDAKRRPVMQPDYEIIVVKNGEKGAYLRARSFSDVLIWCLTSSLSTIKTELCRPRCNTRTTRTTTRSNSRPKSRFSARKRSTTLRCRSLSWNSTSRCPTISSLWNSRRVRK